MFLETAGDVDIYLALRKNNKARLFPPIATTPEACWELEKRGKTFSIPEDFIDPEELYARGIRYFDNVGKLCDEIDSNLINKNETLKTYGFLPAKDNFFFVKILFDSLALRTCLLAAILSRLKPAMVIVCTDKESAVFPCHDNDLPFTNQDRLFSWLLHRLDWGTIIKTTGPAPGNFPKRRPAAPAVIHRMKTRFKKSGLYSLLYLVRSVENRMKPRALFYFLRNSLLRKKTIRVIGYGHEWSLMLIALCREGYGVSFVDSDITRPDRPIPPKNDAMVTCRLDEEHCTVEGHNLAPLIKERLAPVIQTSLASMVQAVQLENQVIRKKPPALFICSIKTTFFDHTIARLAKKNHIPVVSWQHGAEGYFRFPFMFYSELMNSDVHLLWGDGCVDPIVSDPINPYHPKLVVTGSASLELFPQSNVRTRGTGILYATTDYFRNAYYIGYDHRFTDTLFWKTQKEILSALRGSVRPVIFKVHPSTEDTRHFSEFIASGDGKQIQLIRAETSFEDLLAEADVVIIDFPSTTLLQAIATRKTVFVLLKHLMIADDAKSLLKKRAYCSEKLEDFTDLIKKYVNDETIDGQHPDTSNREFLERYGVHKNDGNVTGRVLDALKEVRNSGL